MYLLDTDTLSWLMRSRPPVSLVARVAATPAALQCTSSISIGEIVYGAYRFPGRQAVLLERLGSVVLPQFPILPFDAAAAERYGQIRAQLDRAGTPLAEADLRIAAVALVNDLTVISANLRHFTRVPGLRVENWIL